MRPLRLELQGFASFRDAATVDFDDADLFVLAGPTGAGKSSLLDAMIFALYGVVPRYDDRRLVAPVISQGAAEARVRLAFEVGGATFTATRVVRRRGGGATTKEARLERRTGPDGAAETLAVGADELTSAVERLLGLPFEHFVTTVVLPQGAFQAFLHAKPSERQDLLVELLGLDVYRRLGALARERARDAERDVESLQRRLDGELADATSAARNRLVDRIATLESLRDKLDAAQPELDALRDRGERIAERHHEVRSRLGLLDGVRAPDGVAALAERHRAAVTAAERAETAHGAAVDGCDVAQQTVDDLPDAATLAALRRTLDERSRLLAQADDATAAVQRAERDLHEAEDAVATARRAHDDARAAVEAARRADLARALAADVAVGDDCPVCARPIETPLVAHDVADLDAVRQAERAAEQRRGEADRRREEAATRLAAAAAAREHAARQLEQTTHTRDELAADLRLPPDEGLPSALDELRRRVDVATRALRDARAAEKAARQARDAARAELATVETQRADALAALDDARDSLAPLGPPRLDRDDLAGAWGALLTFVERRRPEVEQELREHDRAIAAARDDYTSRMRELRELCAAHDVQVDDGVAPGVACAQALGRATERLRRLDDDIEQAGRLRAEQQSARRAAQVATELGRHLSVRHFERWLLDRALRRLVVGATAILRDLSGGAYSLALDDASAFEVVDHRNADQRRSARTLSGGETFLASLSLALALGDHVRDLAAEGTARLDALFLDEGFGTLDAETLDVVAGAIEELGARGRMVGLITHVRDLAERVPVRFEVSKVAGASRVERAVP